MPTLLHAPANSAPVWPYSLADLRRDNPNVSFSANPSAEDLAPFDVFQVAPTDPPEHDPATHRVMEVMPAEADGAWRQAWELIELSPPAPPPDWTAFKSGLLTSADVAQVMAAARAAGAEPATTNLPLALQKAEGGDFAEFAACWGMVVAASGAPPEALAALVAAAEACHLPPEFVETLAPSAG